MKKITIVLLLISNCVLAQVELISDIFPGSTSSISTPNFVEFKGKLYFQTTGSYSYSEKIWTYDGTNAPSSFYCY